MLCAIVLDQYPVVRDSTCQPPPTRAMSGFVSIDLALRNVHGFCFLSRPRRLLSDSVDEAFLLVSQAFRLELLNAFLDLSSCSTFSTFINVLEKWVYLE